MTPYSGMSFAAQVLPESLKTFFMFGFGFSGRGTMVAVQAVEVVWQYWQLGGKVLVHEDGLWQKN
jgi:hypothetical protein